MPPFIKKFASLAFVLLVVFVIYTLISTGFFRSVEYNFDGEILQKVAVRGAEDITISTLDSFALISATSRNRSSVTTKEDGGLYLIDLKSGRFDPVLLTGAFHQDFAPHGISYYKEDSIYYIMAINHTAEGHTIESFELSGTNLKHVKTLKHTSMVQPNDLVMIDGSRFYFTNDHGYTKGIGKLLEEYAGLAVSNVIYFDGQNYQEVANGIAYANGINFNKSSNLLFVASPRGFLVKVYSRQKDGTLSFIENIPCATGVDNIELDNNGDLWIGAHPNLLRFNAYAKGKKATSPSEIIKITYRAKGDYTIEKVYEESGENMSGSTVAAVFGDLIFAGNVMDDAFLILKRSNPE